MDQPNVGSSYDELPYVSQAHSETHPDRTSAVARLFGMRPAPEPVERCRVLELGCAQGANIIPMAAALPDAEFYAVDHSRCEVEQGWDQIRQLSLRNIRLEHADFAHLPETAGQFHYIIAHGVYSWIAPEQRDRLLDVCRKHLAPNGLVYVSYNVLPGWYRLMPIRDFLLFHLRDVRPLRLRLDRALELLNWLAAADRNLPPLLRDAVQRIQKQMDDPKWQVNLLCHDLLEERNDPVLFGDFLRHAAEHDLKYLADVEVHKMTPSRLGTSVAEQTAAWSQNREELEQYTDFLAHRQFRSSLLCHPEVTWDDRWRLDQLQNLLLASPVSCRTPAQQLIRRDTIVFQTRNGYQVAAQHPLTKAALLTFSDSWPDPLSWPELIDRARTRLEQETTTGHHADEQNQQELLRRLAEMLASGILLFYGERPRFTTRVSGRPEAWHAADQRAACQTGGDRLADLQFRTGIGGQRLVAGAPGQSCTRAGVRPAG
jgi:SAM-dependent methyltransferase